MLDPTHMGHQAASQCLPHSPSAPVTAVPTEVLAQRCHCFVVMLSLDSRGTAWSS